MLIFLYLCSINQFYYFIMKKHFLHLATAAILALSLSFYACDDDNDDNGGQNNGNNGNDWPYLPQKLGMKVDGNQWESDVESILGRLISPEIYIQGSNKAGTSNIQLVYQGIWNQGTYTVKRAAYSIQSREYVLREAADASITFSSFTVQDPVKQDSTFTGTFEAMLIDTLNTPWDTVFITEGFFENIYFNR